MIQRYNPVEIVQNMMYSIIVNNKQQIYKKGDKLKRIIEKWKGKFLIGGEIKTSLDDWKPKHGARFRIKLLSNKRR